MATGKQRTTGLLDDIFVESIEVFLEDCQEKRAHILRQDSIESMNVRKLC